MEKMERTSLPYSSVYVDSSLSHVLSAVSKCFTCAESVLADKEKKLRDMWTSEKNANPVLPCMTVRTAFDLFLQAQKYPPGSEILMSAVNIEEMAMIVRNLNLKIVPVDIDIDTLEPKIDMMERLISPNTVAILVAHLYGRRADMDPFVSLAQKYKLQLIEDCAENFCGFSYLGHPESDVSLFSFGGIKFLTSFGGCIAKVRDPGVYNKMKQVHLQHPRQTNYEYMKKVLKYGMLYSLFHVWPFPQVLEMIRRTGFDYKSFLSSYLRGTTTNLISNIRKRPSPALMTVMVSRQTKFDPEKFDIQKIKAEYFLRGLTELMWPVGTDVKSNNFWLFPVVVENPGEVIKALGAMGLDAYYGATNLKLLEPDDADKPIGPNRALGETVSANERYPHEAKYLMDHVVYLPINKYVPFTALDKMVKICSSAMSNLSSDSSDSTPRKRRSEMKSDLKSNV